jgi:hypothetical protein
VITVHRHVRRIGDQIALRIEQRTREVQPLLDVHRMRRVLQLKPHLLGDVHEQVVEHLQQHRVHRGSRRKALRARYAAHQFQVIQRGQCGAPARLHHRGGVLLRDDGWAVDHITRAQILAHHQGCLVPTCA